MPRLKKEQIIHLDIDELTEKKSKKNEEASDISLGSILESARKKKKLEIEEISESLRIKAIYLDALEKGHYYAFPARSYAIGFLRNYAKFLKLDPDALVERYHQETSDEKDEPLDMLVLDKKFPLPNFKTVAKILGILCVVYLIWYLIALLLYPETTIPQQPTPPVVTENTTPIAEEVKVEEKKVEEKKAPEIKEISAEVFTSSVAFVATDRVWVSIRDMKNDKIIMSKTLIKNEHFIPKIPLADLAVSTGRPGILDLYLDGKKVKTFSKEENTPLISEEAKD